MRHPALLVVLALAAAGCVNEPETTTAPTPTPTTPTAPTAGAGPADSTTAPSPDDQADAAPINIVGYFSPGYVFDRVIPSEGTEPETLDPSAFFTGQLDQQASWAPWKTDTSGIAREIIGEFEVQLRIRATAAAQQTTPKALEFPGAGGWLGSERGWNIFYLMQDAPERLEANVIHKASARVTLPQGGLFLLGDEPFSPHLWTAYKTADNSPVQYVLGGDDPAHIKVTVRPITLPPVTPLEILSESGEMGPHPGVTTDGNQDAVELPLKIPPEAVYVVIEVTGAPKVAGHVDVDFEVRKGSDAVLSGRGPASNEYGSIGPGNLAAYGRDLTLWISASSVAGNTWTAKATAYVPTG